MLAVFLDMNRIDHTDEGHDDKNIGKQHTEFVHLPQNEVETEKVIRPVITVWHMNQIDKSDDRQQKGKGLANLSGFDYRKDERTDEVDKRRRDDVNHNNVHPSLTNGGRAIWRI